MSTDLTNNREAAIRRLKERRDFWTHAVTFVVFNLAMAGVWYVTGHGYFWPGWLMGAWGAGLAIHGWTIWGQRPISEEDIQRELNRRGGSHA